MDGKRLYLQALVTRTIWPRHSTFRWSKCKRNDRRPPRRPLPVRQYDRFVRNRGSRLLSDYRHPACLDDDTCAATKGVAMFRQRNCCVRKPIISLALRPILSSSRSCRRPSRICFWSIMCSHPLLISCHDVVHTPAECVHALAVKRKCFPSSLFYQHCQDLPRAERASCPGARQGRCVWGVAHRIPRYCHAA